MAKKNEKFYCRTFDLTAKAKQSIVVTCKISSYYSDLQKYTMQFDVNDSQNFDSVFEKNSTHM